MTERNRADQPGGRVSSAKGGCVTRSHPGACDGRRAGMLSPDRDAQGEAHRRPSVFPFTVGGTRPPEGRGLHERGGIPICGYGRVEDPYVRALPQLEVSGSIWRRGTARMESFIIPVDRERAR